MIKKGTKKFTCIICPKCCELETDGIEVIGAGCKKGEEFALQEIVLPVRVITTTIRCESKDGIKMIPVKTAAPVPLEKISEMMKYIKRTKVTEIPALGSHIAVAEGSEPLELIVTGE